MKEEMQYKIWTVDESDLDGMKVSYQKGSKKIDGQITDCDKYGILEIQPDLEEIDLEKPRDYVHAGEVMKLNSLEPLLIEADRENNCMECGEPLPLSKNHREPVFVKGEKYCRSICIYCLYPRLRKEGTQWTDQMHGDYFYCETCGEYSKGSKCLSNMH